MTLSEILHHSTDEFLVLLVLCLVVAGLLKGIIGVGMPIVAMPMLTLLLNVPAAVGLLSVPLLLTNVPQALEGDRTWPRVVSLIPVFAGMIPGTILGVRLLVGFDAHSEYLVVGGILFMVATLMIFKPSIAVSQEHRRSVGLGVGLLGGMLGGLAAMPGPIVFMYLLGCGLRGPQFIKDASIFLIGASAILAVALAAGSHMTVSDVLISCLASIPVFLGMYFGQKLRGFIREEAFRRCVMLVVLLSAVDLIRRGLG